MPTVRWPAARCRQRTTRLDARITFVDVGEQLADALAGIRDPLVGVDVERADGDRYFRRAALVQIGDADEVVLLDPLAVPRPHALAELTRSRTVVLHASANDLEPLEVLGVPLPHLADTAVAAAVLGLPRGLSPLLAELLGVALDTDKSRYQRADWERRPLTEGMATYAAGDVVHLPELWRRLDERLRASGRRQWYVQELEAAVAGARDDDRSVDNVKGAGRLDPRERAVLVALWETREELCRTHDVAPNRMLRDATLLALAQEPAATPAELVARDGRRGGPAADHAGALYAAQERGRTSPELPRTDGPRWSDADRVAYDRMRAARATLADELGLEAGVLCSSRSLRSALDAAPADLEEFATASGLRGWQLDLLLDELWGILASTRAAA